MSEKAMWKALRPLMVGLDPVRIENAVEAGTPDVNYVGGWIELKYLPKWPARATTPIKIAHYTKEQRVFAKRRNAAGGRVFFLSSGGKANPKAVNDLLRRALDAPDA